MEASRRQKRPMSHLPTVRHLIYSLPLVFTLLFGCLFFQTRWILLPPTSCFIQDRIGYEKVWGSVKTQSHTLATYLLCDTRQFIQTSIFSFVWERYYILHPDAVVKITLDPKVTLTNITYVPVTVLWWQLPNRGPRGDRHSARPWPPGFCFPF